VVTINKTKNPFQPEKKPFFSKNISDHPKLSFVNVTFSQSALFLQDISELK